MTLCLFRQVSCVFVCVYGMYVGSYYSSSK